MLGIRTQGKIGYSGTRTQINVVLTITLNTPGSVFLTISRGTITPTQDHMDAAMLFPADDDDFW